MALRDAINQDSGRARACKSRLTRLRRLDTKPGREIAAGFDAAAADGQGKNATELVARTKPGMPPLEAIQAATVNAAELLN